MQEPSREPPGLERGEGGTATEPARAMVISATLVCVCAAQIGGIAMLAWLCRRTRREMRDLYATHGMHIHQLENRLQQVAEEVEGWENILRELRNSRRLLRQLIHPDNQHTPILDFAAGPGDAPMSVYFLALVATELDGAGNPVNVSYRRIHHTRFYNR